jgi:hypothetical protein
LIISTFQPKRRGPNIQGYYKKEKRRKQYLHHILEVDFNAIFIEHFCVKLLIR